MKGFSKIEMKMNSKERIQAAISLKMPDRVPVDLHNFQTAAFATGLPLNKIFQDGELLAQSMLDAWREFGHDMILLENGTACNAQACGVEVAYRENAAPAALQPIIHSLKDISAFEVPDPYTTFPMNEILKAVKILSKEIGNKVWICGRADQGPMGLAAQLRGISEFMLDIALGENDHFIHALLDFARQVISRFAYALVECGSHSTSIGDSIAGPDILSPKHYKIFAWDQEKKLISEMREQGIIMHLHICGNINKIKEDFVNTGAPILEVDHKTDSHKIKDAAAGKACLLGNIDTNLLANGSSEEVKNACRDLIEIWKPGSGFILGPGCAMGSSTPSDNIHALVESAKKYGQYH
jgi:uroporphyrinogen decarboxylase